MDSQPLPAASSNAYSMRDRGGDRGGDREGRGFGQSSWERSGAGMGGGASSGMGGDSFSGALSRHKTGKIHPDYRH